MESLGDRIKRYERVTQHVATPRMPLMVRVDGRAFHTFTKGFKKPFDADLMAAMDTAAMITAHSIDGCKAAYVQSDEVTFCMTDYDTLNTQGWFGYELPKIISLTASMMSVNFNRALERRLDGTVKSSAVFDSRAFSVPREDVVNAFLWRAKDWERNSLQMLARSHFSTRQLHGKKRADMHEMLHEKGVNWVRDCSERERNGTLFYKNVSWCKEHPTASYQAFANRLEPLFAIPETE